MLFAVIFLLIAYTLYLTVEKYLNDKALSSFRYVVHVNGTRGKTEVCRLLDAVFRAAGYSVYTKTTGTTAFTIDPSGYETPLKRKGAPNISEQLRIIRRAYRAHADVLILECMAVAPELQKASQEQIVKGTFNVITNVRYDHVFEMGSSLSEIAAALAAIIPEQGVLLTADPDFFPYFSSLCQKKNTKIYLCQADQTASSENLAIAWQAARLLGMDEAAFHRSLSAYRRDFGVQACYPLSEHAQFLNLFSVNDPQSTSKLLEHYLPEHCCLNFVYNHRTDRPDRLLLFIRYFFPEHPCQKLIVTGENTAFACRLLRKSGLQHVSVCKDLQMLMQEAAQADPCTFYVGIGNIKGAAYDWIQFLEARFPASVK